MYLYYKINENNVLLHECVTMLFEQLKLNKITGRAFAHVIKKFLYTILKQNISFFCILIPSFIIAKHGH